MSKLTTLYGFHELFLNYCLSVNVYQYMYYIQRFKIIFVRGRSRTLWYEFFNVCFVLLKILVFVSFCTKRPLLLISALCVSLFHNLKDLMPKLNILIYTLLKKFDWFLVFISRLSSLLPRNTIQIICFQLPANFTHLEWKKQISHFKYSYMFSEIIF